jgi:hypothetical protein
MYYAEYAILIKSGNEIIHVEHDHHEEGIFEQETWLSLLTQAGFEPRMVADPTEPGRFLFVGYKP